MKNPMKARLSRVLLLIGLATSLALEGCILFPPPHSDYRPLHQAAGGCDVTTVSAILATNMAALNITEDGGRGPLHVAAAHCCTNVMILLIEKGAKLELKGNTGETPLHVAAQEGCGEAVALLVSKGANINARDNKGHTPLKRAIDYEQNSTADLLRKLGGI
jgi:cytohesin